MAMCARIPRHVRDTVLAVDFAYARGCVPRDASKLANTVIMCVCIDINLSPTFRTRVVHGEITERIWSCNDTVDISALSMLKYTRCPKNTFLILHGLVLYVIKFILTVTNT